MSALDRQIRFLLGLFLSLSLLALTLSAGVCYGQDPAAVKDYEVKASLNTESSGTLKSISFSPLSLRGGSKLTLISPQVWAPLANRIRKTLESTHDYYTNLFGEIPAFKTAIRLMDEDTFFATTGAPRWTNAMYFRNQIVIPLPLGADPDYESINRAVKHEYTHAVVHALSGGRCPGWLDEGLAQWAEGSENPALQPALKSWVMKRGAVPLRLLQGGFTKLDANMVPAAYAQSLYSAYVVLNSYGFEILKDYFDYLRRGEDKSWAFEQAFEIQEDVFENKLDLSLRHWVKGKGHQN